MNQKLHTFLLNQINNKINRYQQLNIQTNRLLINLLRILKYMHKQQDRQSQNPTQSQKQTFQVQISKQPVKTVTRNPPPPPGKKVLAPPPIKNRPIIQQSNFPNQEQVKQQRSLNMNNVNQSVLHEKNKFPQKISEKNNISLDNSRNSQEEQITQNNSISVKKNNNQPIPPPPNRNMKDMLTKKLAVQKQISKPPPIKNYTKIDEFGQNYNQISQINQDISVIRGAAQDKKSPSITKNNIKNVNNINKINQIDEQYANNHDIIKQVKQTKSLIKNTRQNQNNQQNINPLLFISQWMANPQITLKQLFPSLKQTIQFYCLNKHISLDIVSTNSNFNQLTVQFIHSFIINNTVKFTSYQKKITQQIGLKYFYTNSVQMNDVFLILLVKIGKLNGLIYNKQIQNLKQSLGLLSFCKLNLKSKPNLMALYLKIIYNLAPQFTQSGLVQKILNHLKQIQIPQSLYQFSKQLKLRLLKTYDNQNKIQEKNNKNQNITNNQSNQSKDKGLFGYFNLNKAIDKIKTSTQKALNAVQKTVQKQTKPQEEQKKDEIIYDPIKKRYVINGQIPQDQNGKRINQGDQQTKQKTPPPPPLGGKKKTPPPPPIQGGKKPVSRVAVNRYV